MDKIPELDRKGLRQFGVTFGVIIGVLFGLVLPWLFGFGFPVWPWVVALVFFCWALVIPTTLGWFYRLWMRFGFVLNAIMSRVILGIVYYCVVLPTGLIMRIKGRDPMRRGFDSELVSYRIENEAVDKNRMEKPF